MAEMSLAMARVLGSPAAMVFPVVMYRRESWTVKKAERRKIDAFELWCWRRLLRVPWTATRSNQSILRRSALGFLWKEWCWSWNSSTLAISCEELTQWKRLWCWRDWRQEEKGTTQDEMAGWHHWLNGRESQWAPGVGDGQGGLVCCDSWGRKESDTTERLIWSDLIWYCCWGFPGGISGKEPASQCRRSKRCWFDLWVGKILWRRACQPTPVFLPGKILWTEQPGGLQSIETHRVRHDWSDWVHTADGLSSNLAWQTKEESSVS